MIGARGRRGARPLVLAHRGSRLRAPENTLEAFALALQEGADGIELDVRRTADGVPVVLHDPALDRTTDGRGPLAVTTFADLRRLDAGAWFDRRHRGAHVPSLAEVLDLCGGRAVVNIELKIDSGRGLAARRAAIAEAPRLAEAVALDLARARRGGFVLVSSFSARALQAAHAVMRNVPLGWLRSRSTRGLAALNRRLRLHSVNPNLRLASARRFAAARRLGLSVYVYPVNVPGDITRLARLGATGLITDDPLVALSTLQHHRDV
ncbi:MAG TPA: glycerophosphodiester phosphodiesterase family protein [Candidatus Polarisedimenticolia bacterium]|nr:glycerophosphodiester phosphodiesterase family protein [Candidatus Polarisedimenticolia bacterium]